MTTPGPTCACPQDCGKPAAPGRRGYSEACHSRWLRAGKPEGGPPPPLGMAERMAIARAARPVTRPPDTYEAQWYAGEPERKVGRARPLAAALARCVAARDAHGVELVLHKLVTWEDMAALAVVLAECASPERTAAVTGTGAAGSDAA